MQFFESEWASYLEADLEDTGRPLDPAVSRECRRAFYCGAICLFGELDKLMMDSDVPVVERGRRFRELRAELEAFPFIEFLVNERNRLLHHPGRSSVND